jgi:hypothetical protein
MVQILVVLAAILGATGGAYLVRWLLSRRAPPRSWRATVGAIVGVACAAAIVSVRSKPGKAPVGPLAAAMQNDPAYKAYLEGKSDRVAATQELMIRGMARLPPDEVRDVARFYLKLASRAPAACAGLWPAAPDTLAVGAAVRSLPPSDLSELSALTADAMRRELHRDGEARVKPSGDEAVDRALKAAEGALGGEAGRRLDALARRGAKASPDEACEGSKLLLDAITKLPDGVAGDVFMLML